MSNRFVFVKELPPGGFGKIELFRDTQTGQIVVKKSLLHPNEDNCQRMITEGRYLIALKDDPNIIDLLYYSFDPQNPFLVFPYYEHGTLQDEVGKTNWYDAMGAVQNLAAGLEAVHRQGGIHRDVKPANVYKLVTIQGKRILLGDFGLGQIPQPFNNWNITMYGRGTAGYAAPELFSPGAKFTQACDIYSLGVTGIELITGSRDPNTIRSYWGVSDNARQLLLAMTSLIPSQRPTAKDVKERARAIVEAQYQFTNSLLSVAAIGSLLFLGYKALKD